MATIERSAVSCDTCTEVSYGGPFQNAPRNQYEANREAVRDGWRLGIIAGPDGRPLDLCPTCYAEHTATLNQSAPSSSTLEENTQ